MPDACAGSRLDRFIDDARQHVGLYRRLWGPAAGSGLRGAGLLDKAALRACPPADRVHVQRRGRALATELSSGSSGEPLAIYSDGPARRARRLAFLRALWSCGFRPGQRLLLLTSRREGRWGHLFGWHYASIAEATGALARHALALRPRVLYGPLSTLELLAEHFWRHHERLPGLRLVVSTAEQLTPERLALLERGLGAPVADFYGMTEFGLVAWRPPGSRDYRSARSSLVLEFLPVPGDDAVERLVITDLAERTSPLIRYDTGDLVRRDPAHPDRPVLEFAGRAFDCIVLPGGRRLSPYRIDVALEELPGLHAFEVVQQPDLSIDVTIDVPPADAERVRGAIAGRLRALLGELTPFRIAVRPIRRDPSGAKFRPIRSLAGAGA